MIACLHCAESERGSLEVACSRIRENSEAVRLGSPYETLPNSHEFGYELTNSQLYN